jgi:hypothetical protein
MTTTHLTDDEQTLTLVGCPQCGESASIEWQSVGGQMRYVKTHCIQRHWFLLPSNMVTRYPATRWDVEPGQG